MSRAWLIPVAAVPLGVVLTFALAKSGVAAEAAWLSGMALVLVAVAYAGAQQRRKG